MTDMDRTEISGIEEIRLVEPDDYASRHARLQREAAGWNEITAHFELEEAAKPKKAARVPRDTEPCNLVSFLGIVAGGTAAGLIALALAGWGIESLVDLGLQWAGVR